MMNPCPRHPGLIRPCLCHDNPSAALPREEKVYDVVGHHWRAGRRAGLVVHFTIRTADGITVDLSLRNAKARAPFDRAGGRWQIDLRTARLDRLAERRLRAALLVAHDPDLVPTLLAAVEDERINL